MDQALFRSSPWRGGLLVIFCGLFNCACATFSGAPERYRPVADIVASLQLTTADLSALATVKEQSTRNQLQNKALTVIDIHYAAFVDELYLNYVNSAASFSGFTLATSSAGALVTSAAAKTRYALLGAAAVGAHTIIDKNYYYDKTLAALVAGMKAARSGVLLRIRQRQQTAVLTYDGLSAITDIEDYYTAGTLHSAIADITTHAEIATQANLTEIRALPLLSDAEIERRRRITAAIYAIQDAVTMAKGNQALELLGLPRQALPAQTRTALVGALQPRTSEKITAVEQALNRVGLLP